eukprot:UN2175
MQFFEARRMMHMQQLVKVDLQATKIEHTSMQVFKARPKRRMKHLLMVATRTTRIEQPRTQSFEVHLVMHMQQLLVAESHTTMAKLTSMQFFEARPKMYMCVAMAQTIYKDAMTAKLYVKGEVKNQGQQSCESEVEAYSKIREAVDELMELEVQLELLRQRERGAWAVCARIVARCRGGV